MSITTLYHTPNKSTEDATAQSCKDQVCNVCDADFKMIRGCSLEKRCPACRFLKLQKIDTYGLKLVDSKQSDTKVYRTVVENVRSREFRLFDETLMYVNLHYDMQELDMSSDEVINSELASKIDDAFLCLSERERIVMIMTFGLDGNGWSTLKEMGKSMSVSQERVRQIQMSAMKKMKHPKVGRLLKEYSTI